MQRAVLGDEDVAAEVDGDGVGSLFFWVGGWGGRGRGLLTHEVAADDNVVLDDGLAGEDDVGGAVEEGAAGDFVASVLQGGGVMVNMIIGREGLVEGRGDGRTYSLDVFAASGAFRRHVEEHHDESCQLLQAGVQ
jgi:hypothetical protein